MQWWCAATAQEWSWTWRAYPGVWLMVALLAGAYGRRLNGGRAAGRPGGSVPIRYPVTFSLGLLFLWAMFDWPVGTLGTGYLLSVHTPQYVVLTLVAMPLLLAGVPAGAWPAPGSGLAARLLRGLGSPVLGLGLYRVAMVVTHIPAITDALRQSQLGSFGVDMLWLAGGFALWWPVLAPEITTDWGAFTETVVQGVTGFRCRNVEEFILATQNVKNLDRQAIRDRAISLYSVDVIAKQYEKYFERLLTLWGDGWYTEGSNADTERNDRRGEN